MILQNYHRTAQNVSPVDRFLREEIGNRFEQKAEQSCLRAQIH